MGARGRGNGQRDGRILEPPWHAAGAAGAIVALAVVAVRVLVGVLPSGDGGAGTGRMVVAVAHDSPADAARIQGGGGAGGAITGQGDVIVRVGKRQIAGPDDLAAAIHDLAPGRQVQIEIVRGGQHHTVPVELADRPG